MLSGVQVDVILSGKRPESDRATVDHFYFAGETVVEQVWCSAGYLMGVK